MTQKSQSSGERLAIAVSSQQTQFKFGKGGHCHSCLEEMAQFAFIEATTGRVRPYWEHKDAVQGSASESGIRTSSPRKTPSNTAAGSFHGRPRLPTISAMPSVSFAWQFFASTGPNSARNFESLACCNVWKTQLAVSLVMVKCAISPRQVHNPRPTGPRLQELSAKLKGLLTDGSRGSVLVCQ